MAPTPGSPSRSATAISSSCFNECSCTAHSSPSWKNLTVQPLAAGTHRSTPSEPLTWRLPCSRIMPTNHCDRPSCVKLEHTRDPGCIFTGATRRRVLRAVSVIGSSLRVRCERATGDASTLAASSLAAVTLTTSTRACATPLRLCRWRGLLVAMSGRRRDKGRAANALAYNELVPLAVLDGLSRLLHLHPRLARDGERERGTASARPRARNQGGTTRTICEPKWLK
eukprot:scaffold76807_cov66-Phaeocystis_antarctica.AAC.2